MSLIPWGPVSLWGPTETRVDDLEAGYHVEPEDVRFLLDEWNRHAARPVGPSDVVSLRCGVRPLAQRTGRESEGGTLSISRRHRVVTDDARRWTTLYGGKITGCTLLGREVGTRLAARLRPTGVPSAGAPVARPPCSERFPGLEQPVLSTRWAAEQEQCFTLDDYLRRRTNISQWVPRMGLGRSGEFAAAVRALAQAFPGASGATPDHAAWAYGERVQRELDAVLAAV